MMHVTKDPVEFLARNQIAGFHQQEATDHIAHLGHRGRPSRRARSLGYSA